MTMGIWLTIALLLSLGGYAVYLAGLRRHLVEPNRASWLIWATAAGIEAATYAAVNPGAPQAWVFGLSAVACTVVTLTMWRRSRWRAPSPVEGICIAVSLAAIALWLAFHETFWAHMLVVAAVPISFWPTWVSVREDPARERSPAWGMWTLGDLATLIIAANSGATGIREYGYILVELGAHGSVWLMVGLLSLNPARSLGQRRGPFYVLDAYRPRPNPFAVGESHLGKAVFAARPFADGETLLRFSGRRVRGTPPEATGRQDRYVQIGPDEYLGPSGRVDDLINHSCDPNAGLRFGAGGVFLVALRPIAAGEEVSWDYSTTLKDSDWRMPCDCRAATCRGLIGNFDTIPSARQAWFVERELVAPYLLEEPALAVVKAA
ncbi:MAG: protein-lysine N-methyltransferase [Sphingomonas bacterium]|uniref:SET domain-containing protein n=1 Tax=Sphingomonas bacterium TaxID=1895847 RepID=UPI00262A1821|nr:SET domain-containing protein-lysine N-methyltransferase [Sphingomonas bacterium]MDB5695464.1 protein-lysine N-methyltransferase [Sphingomonas bacterium]